MGTGRGLGPPGPRVPVEDILLFLLSKFGGRSWPGVRVANLSVPLVCESSWLPHLLSLTPHRQRQGGRGS